MYAKMFKFKTTEFDCVTKTYFIKNAKNAKKINNELDE